MSIEYVKILLRQGLRTEINEDLLEVGEPGFAYDTNQLYIGTDDALNELVFDPFANAHAVIQTWLDSVENPEPGLMVDEDLIVRNVTDVDAILAAMASSILFPAGAYARARRNVEVVTENSFNQMFADQHLSVFDPTSGLRSSLFHKELLNTSGTFLRYNKNICTSFFIEYSLKQTNGVITYVRVGDIKVINGVPQGIAQCKLTDDNTEIWQDDGDLLEESNEFSNIEFSAQLDADYVNILYTQNAGFITNISYTVKRWSM
jgi:hypothetical protein